MKRRTHHIVTSLVAVSLAAGGSLLNGSPATATGAPASVASAPAVAAVVSERFPPYNRYFKFSANLRIGTGGREWAHQATQSPYTTSKLFPVRFRFTYPGKTSRDRLYKYFTLQIARESGTQYKIIGSQTMKPDGENQFKPSTVFNSQSEKGDNVVYTYSVTARGVPGSQKRAVKKLKTALNRTLNQYKLRFVYTGTSVSSALTLSAPHFSGRFTPELAPVAAYWEDFLLRWTLTGDMSKVYDMEADLMVGDTIVDSKPLCDYFTCSTGPGAVTLVFNNNYFGDGIGSQLPQGKHDFYLRFRSDTNPTVSAALNKTSLSNHSLPVISSGFDGGDTLKPFSRPRELWIDFNSGLGFARNNMDKYPYYYGDFLYTDNSLKLAPYNAAFKWAVNHGGKTTVEQLPASVPVQVCKPYNLVTFADNDLPGFETDPWAGIPTKYTDVCAQLLPQSDYANPGYTLQETGGRALNALSCSTLRLNSVQSDKMEAALGSIPFDIKYEFWFPAVSNTPNARAQRYYNLFLQAHQMDQRFITYWDTPFNGVKTTDFWDASFDNLETGLSCSLAVQ